MYAITAHDRALIDQAIAAGAARKIPASVFGIDCVTGKPYPSIEAAFEAHKATVRRCLVARHAPMDERDRKIKQCRRQGLTIRETAAKTGLAISVIHGRFRKMNPGATW